MWKRVYPAGRALLFPSAQSSFSTSLGSGLISYWDLSEDTAAVRADSVTSTANDLTAFNNVSRGGGVGSYACNFVIASTQKLTVTDSSSIQTGDIDFSWAGWVHLDAIAANQYVLCKRVSQVGSNDWEYFVNYNQSTGKFNFSVANGSTSGTVASTESPSAGVWYFVACVHDSVNNLLKISVNGGTYATTSYSSGGQVLSGTNLLFGVAVTNLYLGGALQNWGFWKNWCLTAGEVTTMYNSGKGVNYSALSGVTAPTRWWQMSEASGNNRVDSVASDAAVPTNTPTRRSGVVSVNGTNLSARFILGSSQYLLRSANTSTNIDGITGNFTIAGFACLDILAASQYTLWGKGATSDAIAGWWLNVSSSNRLQCTFGNGTSRITVTPTNTVTAGTWFHFAVTFDRSGNEKVFFNGAAGTGTPTGSIAALTGSIGTTNMTFGGLTYSTFSTGQMAFCGVWNRVLSDSEISTHYNSGSGLRYNQL